MPEQHPVAEGIALPRGGILQLRGQPFHENLPVFRRNRLPGRGEQRGRVAKYHLQRLPEEFPLLLRRKLLPVVQREKHPLHRGETVLPKHLQDGGIFVAGKRPLCPAPLPEKGLGVNRIAGMPAVERFRGSQTVALQRLSGESEIERGVSAADSFETLADRGEQLRILPAQRLKQQNGFAGDLRIQILHRQPPLNRGILCRKQNLHHAQSRQRRFLPEEVQMKQFRLALDSPGDAGKGKAVLPGEMPDSLRRRRRNQKRNRLFPLPAQQKPHRVQIPLLFRREPGAVPREQLRRRLRFAEAEEKMEVGEDPLRRLLPGRFLPEEFQRLLLPVGDEIEYGRIVLLRRIGDRRGVARQQRLRLLEIADPQQHPAEFIFDPRIPRRQFSRLPEMAERILGTDILVRLKRERQKEMQFRRVGRFLQRFAQLLLQLQPPDEDRIDVIVRPRPLKSIQKIDLLIEALLRQEDPPESLPEPFRRGLSLQKFHQEAVPVFSSPERGGRLFFRRRRERRREKGEQKEKQQHPRFASVHASASLSAACRRLSFLQNCTGTYPDSTKY